MKKTGMAIMMMGLLMVGCGRGPAGAVGPAGAQGPQGVPGQDAPTLVDFEGYYNLPDGGWADMYQDAQGMIAVRSMRLVVKNADGSYALIPVGGVPALPQVNGTVYYRLTPTYAPLSHNLKKDSDSTLLSGPMLTEVRLSMNGQKLKITAIVSGPFSLAYLGSVESL